MTEKLPPYTAEEREILRFARFAKEVVDSEFWKVYERTLLAQIAQREQVLLTPLTDIPLQPGEVWDFNTRVMKSELIKGAVIGLRLALSIPKATIDHAATIVREYEPPEKEESP